MQRSQFTQIIKNLCEHIDIEDWQTVVATQHLVVDGTSMGLLFREEPPTPAGHSDIYLQIDLGQLETPELHPFLLHLNSDQGTLGEGSFGLCSERGHVMYRTAVLIERGAQPDIERLADACTSFVTIARNRYGSALEQFRNTNHPPRSRHPDFLQSV